MFDSWADETSYPINKKIEGRKKERKKLPHERATIISSSHSSF